MRTRLSLTIITVILLVAASSCNLPQPTPTQDANLALTAAVQTVGAQLTQSAINQGLPSPTVIVLPPTNTPPAPPTFAPPPTGAFTATQECDRAQFVTDVNIPDGSSMMPGQAFTKTWRLKNIGACTWSGYSLVFDEGNSMSGAAATAIGSTPPGASVDISISLTAPTAPASYRGYWRIRNASGVLIPVTGGHNGKSFYVDIKVAAPTSTPATFNLPYLAAESGLALSSGGINNATVAVGDSIGNEGVEAFLSFDISGIPANATIQTASLELIGGGHVRGNPFASLGCLRAYVHNYGSLDAGDFVAPGATGAFAKWCSAGELSVSYSDSLVVSAVQSAVGTTRFRIRLQFRDALTDSDATIDDVLIISPVVLTVTYTVP
ncbi:MAG: hypothetical protein HFACDABA_01476 [Anaerolineales bacterium]|nr:hypothetical protein [Anaerolineales bacterium]